jgi:DeoR/GlpR family transcriptional regulator of sugar metabolism
MALINRRQQIYNELEQKGYVNVVDLCETHNVSTNQDLNFLENEKLLHRMHGGKPVYAFERNVDERGNASGAKKANRRRVKYISNSDYIILGSGSNIHYLSRIIKGFDKLTVLTPSLKVC